MTQEYFEALWKIDDLAACPTGMILLKKWVGDPPSGDKHKEARRTVAGGMA
jgi:hypothetical protein